MEDSTPASAVAMSAGFATNSTKIWKPVQVKVF